MLPLYAPITHSNVNLRAFPIFMVYMNVIQYERFAEHSNYYKTTIIVLLRCIWHFFEPQENIGAADNFTAVGFVIEKKITRMLCESKLRSAWSKVLIMSEAC